jgi:hypothetical protein
MDTKGKALDPLWLKACQTWKPLSILFEKVSKLKQELVASKALVEEYKAKVEQLEHDLHDLQEEKYIVLTLCGQKHYDFGNDKQLE